MKIQNTIIIFALILLNSCNKTNIIENEVNLQSNEPPKPGYFKKNVLIEDFTGTWCGNCLRVVYAIDKVKEKTKKIVPVAVHDGSDPFKFSDVAALKRLVEPSDENFALPKAKLNRLATWNYPEVSNLASPINMTSENCALGIAISSTIVSSNSSNTNIDLKIKTKFKESFNNLKIVVYLLENKLIYYQSNYLSYYNNGNNIQNFEHNHTLRKCLTSIIGDPVSNTTQGNIYEKTFDLNIPSSIIKENIEFVAFIVDANNNVINVRNSLISENQTFEENQ